MSTVRQTGITPPYGQSIQEVAAQTAIGASPPSGKAPQVNLNLDDTVAQTAGAAGSAVTTVGTDPRADQIRALLTQGKFDAIAQLIRSGSAPLGQLDLTVDEITKIAEGLGQGSWTQSLPLMGSYSDGDKALITSLIQASHLSTSDTLRSLETLVGQDATMSYLRSHAESAFTSLSTADRQKLLQMTMSDNSVTATVSSAANELVNRRIMGNRNQIEDELASKILRSARNDVECLQLLDQINQFSRDDVAYRYVMDLSPKQLAGLSDKMKVELLKRLVDTSVNLGVVKLDLNSLGNLDEVAGMVSDLHAAAATRLVEGLQSDTRNSAEVQALVQKSDRLVQRLQAIEQDLKSGHLSRTQIADYAQELTAMKAQAQGNPELLTKIENLQKALQAAQTQLQQTEQSGQLALDNVKALSQSLDQTQSKVDASRAELSRCSDNLKQSETQLKGLESQMMQQYNAFYQSLAQVQGAGAEYRQLVSEMQALIQKGLPARIKLPQLEQLGKRLQDMALQVQNGAQKQQGLFQQVEQNAQTLASLRSVYNQAASNFNIDKATLEAQKQILASSLQSYGQQVTQLEQKYDQAKDALQAVAAAGGNVQEAQTALDEIGQAADRHSAMQTRLQAEFEHTLVPKEVQLLSDQDNLASQWQDFKARLDAADNAQDRAEILRQKATEVVDRVSQLVGHLLGDVSRFTQSIKQRISTATPAELNQMLGQVEQKIQALSKAGVPPEQLQAGLQELQAVRQMVQELSGYLTDTQQAQSGLQGELEQLNQSRDLLNVQLEQASTDVTQASQHLHEAKQVIQKTRQEMDSLKTELSAYQQNVDDLQQRLSDAEGQSQKAKDDFRRVLNEMAQQAKEGAVSGANPAQAQEKMTAQMQALKSKLEAVEALRTRLQTQLGKTQQSVIAVTSRMQHEREQLKQQEKVIEQQESLLNRAQDKVKQHKEALSDLDGRSQELLQRVDAKLQEYEGKTPDNQALKAQLAALRQSRTEVENSSLHSKELMIQANQDLTATVASLKQAREQKSDIRQMLGQISGFEQSDLAHATEDLSALQARFNQIEAKRQEVMNKAQGLLSDMSSGDGKHVLSVEDVRTRGIGLLDEIEHADTVDKVMSMFMPIIQQTRQLVAAASEVGKSLDEQAGAVHSMVAEAQGLFGDTDAISQEISQLQTAVRESQSNLLGVQRDLLEKRRGLGIQVDGYQALLSRYASLIDQGSLVGLGPEQIQELSAIEGQLSQIETSLAGSSAQLGRQIESLNATKARVNQRVSDLHHKIEHLQRLRQSLAAKEPEIQASRTEMLSYRDRLLEKRQYIVAAIQQLRNHFGNVDVARQHIAEFESLLHELDQGLAGINQRLSQSDQILTLIHTTVEQIDQEISVAKLQLSQLELIAGKLDQLLEDAGHLKDDLDQLLKQVQELKANVSDLKEKIEVQLETAPQGSTASRQTNAAAEGQDARVSNEAKQEQLKTSFSRKLSDGLTSLWASRRRQESQERGQKYEDQRELFKTDLEQRLALVRHYQEEVKTSIQKQQRLEQVTEHLVQEAHMGVQTSSVLNVVNVTGNEQTHKPTP